MQRRLLLAGIVSAAAFAACSTPLPPGMIESRAIRSETLRLGEQKLLPSEFSNFSTTLSNAEMYRRKGDGDQAARCFRLAWQEGEVMRENMLRERLRLEEEARAKAEEERLAREREQAAAEAARLKAVEEKEREEETRRKVERRHREKPLPASHTVRKGESLPQIAAHADVYGDASLWPLLYRANRDQIKDPRSVFAGQVLRIPRGLSREESAEARRYAQEHPIN